MFSVCGLVGFYFCLGAEVRVADSGPATTRPGMRFLCSFLCTSQRNEPKKRAIGTYGSLGHLPWPPSSASRRRHWFHGSDIRYHEAHIRRGSIKTPLPRLCGVLVSPVAVAVKYVEIHWSRVSLPLSFRMGTAREQQGGAEPSRDALKIHAHTQIVQGSCGVKGRFLQEAPLVGFGAMPRIIITSVQ